MEMFIPLFMAFGIWLGFGLILIFLIWVFTKVFGKFW